MNKYELFWNEIIELINNNLEIGLLITKINKLLEEKFNSGIIVEISKTNNDNEIIFCGGHDIDKVNLIKSIVKSVPEINSTTIIGPKPGFGFDFTININNKNIESSKLYFYPLKNKTDNNLGICLYLDGFDYIDENILWKIIETGIGEEKASLISYIAYDKEYDNESLDINLLDNYVEWYFNK